MNAMAFWSKSCGFNGWRKAHFVEGAWHTTACATSKTLDELNAHGEHWALVTVEEAQAQIISRCPKSMKRGLWTCWKCFRRSTGAERLTVSHSS